MVKPLGNGKEFDKGLGVEIICSDYDLIGQVSEVIPAEQRGMLHNSLEPTVFLRCELLRHEQPI